MRPVGITCDSGVAYDPHTLTAASAGLREFLSSAACRVDLGAAWQMFPHDRQSIAQHVLSDHPELFTEELPGGMRLFRVDIYNHFLHVIEVTHVQEVLAGRVPGDDLVIWKRED